MPPKKGGDSKAVQKAKDKYVEDKTFGLKNKNKSKVVQKYVQHVSANVKGTNDMIEEERRRQRKMEKERLEQEKREMGALFKPVVAKPKIETIQDGVDPKTVLCQYFKAGFCSRGKACKFSHDLALEGKGAKINLYNDPRAQKDSTNEEEWDDEKLKTAVDDAEARRRADKKMPATDIICKFFLEAVETNKYGWFWKCPNGGEDCHYRHCLPPGFVLKDRTKKKEDNEFRTLLEEELEEARTLLSTRTPVTTELFLEWKAKKVQKKKEQMEEKRREAEAAQKKKGGQKLMSGRLLFEYRPEIFQDDLDAADYVRQTDEDYYGTTAVEEVEAVAVDEGLFGGDDFDDDLGEEEEAQPATEQAPEPDAQASSSGLPKLIEDELLGKTKKELVELLQAFGDQAFVLRHQVGGNVTNVVKKKKIGELQDAYRELAKA